MGRQRMIAHDRAHIEFKDALSDEFSASLHALELLKMPEKKKRELARTSKGED